jgi:RND family efflux transporter MFP subunit
MVLVSVRLMVLLALAASPWVVRADETSILVDDQNCLVKPKQVIQLGSPVFGVLSKVFVDRADTVAAGQVVAKLDTSVEEAQLALDRFRADNTTQIEAARADLAWNERELARRKQLAGNMFSKANDIDEVTTKAEQDRIAIRKAESDQTTAALEAQRSARQFELKMIRSPVNGVVSEMKLSPGEFIYEQTPIMTIAQIDPLNVDVVLPASRYGVVRAGSIAQLRLEAPVKLTLPATVDAVDPIIDAASDTFRIRLVLPNPGNSIPAGIRCSVRFANLRDDARE